MKYKFLLNYLKANKTKIENLTKFNPDKKLLLFVIFIIIVSPKFYAQTDYYWHNNQKIYLEKKPNKKFVIVDNNVIDSVELKQIINIHDVSVSKFKTFNIYGTINHYNEDVIGEKTWAILENSDLNNIDISENEYVLYEAPHYYLHGKEYSLSHLFYVKLFQEEDLSKLKSLSQEHNVNILGNNYFMPLWFTLECTQHSTGNSLEMANLFYETNLFKSAQPDLMGNSMHSTTQSSGNDYCSEISDPYFEDQWGLKNTGQQGGYEGIEIKACDAWEITKGNSDIVVAVLDKGIEMDHPDLEDNIYHKSYDTGSPLYDPEPSIIYDDDPHGTNAAGIIGAIHNDIGVAGIAPNCKLMSISNCLLKNPNSWQNRANGIIWAYENGADIISNSWGSAYFEPIEDAINDALTYGRNNKGTVIVFSSGNDGGNSIPFPAHPKWSYCCGSCGEMWG